MASFEHRSFQEDRDRQLHYNFFNVGGSSTLYSCYWLAWSGLAKPGQCSFGGIHPFFLTSATLSHEHQRLRPRLPYMAITPQLSLWYDTSHWHGSLFLHQLERSTEWLKSALPDPPPKKTSSLDLHQQKRSSQADATSMDDMHTVYYHTHSIIRSSNARLGEAAEKCESKGLLSGVASLSLQIQTKASLLTSPSISRSAAART